MSSRHLVTKIQDEMKALQLCQSKVRQKKLPMEVIDAEYQWCAAIDGIWLCLSLTVYRDRRKLTFYFVAEKRIDFRELVRELFRCAPPSIRNNLTPNMLSVCIKPGFGWRPFRDLVDMNSSSCTSLHAVLL